MCYPTQLTYSQRGALGVRLKRPLAITTALLLLLVATPVALLHGHSSPEPPSLETIIRDASLELEKNGIKGRDKIYMLYLGGHILTIQPDMLRDIWGYSITEVCFLAYTSHGWKTLHYTPYTSILKDKRFTVFSLAKTLGPNTKIALKLPLDPPEKVDPAKHTPPQARGAQKWGWIILRLGSYEYPILVAAGSDQIRETCGSTAGLYTVINNMVPSGLEKAGGIPYPAEYLIEHKSKYKLDALQTIKIIKTIVWTTPENLTIEPDFHNRHPLPDGGGGGGSEPPQPEKADLAWIQDYMVPLKIKDPDDGFHKVWNILTINITTCYDAKTITLYPISNNSNISLNYIKIKRIAIVVSGIPIPREEKSSLQLFTLSIDLILNDTKNSYSSNIYLIGLAYEDEYFSDYDVATFEPPEEDPYTFNTRKFTLIIDPILCNSLTEGSNIKEWKLFLKIYYQIELNNYEKYLNNKILFINNITLIYNDIDESFIKLAIPAGDIGWSNRSYGIYSLSSNIVLYDIKDSSIFPLTLQLPLDIYLPAGFPGGFLTLTFEGLGSILIDDLPQVDTDKKMTVVGDLHISSIQDLARAFMVGGGLIAANISLYSPAPDNLIVKIGVNKTLISYYNSYLKIKSIPIMEIYDNEAVYGSSERYYNYIILSPLINITKYHSIDEYVTRYRYSVNIYREASPVAYRYGFLVLNLASRGPTVSVDLWLKPESMSYYSNYTYLGIGKIRSFEIYIKIYNDDPTYCDTGTVIVGAASREGPWIFEFLEKYLHIGKILKIIDIESRISIGRYIKISSDDLIDIVSIALKYRSITNININKECYPYNQGSMQIYEVSASNSGWMPDGFKNRIYIKYSDSLHYNPIIGVDCNSIKVDHLEITTDSAGLVFYGNDLGWARACQEYG